MGPTVQLELVFLSSGGSLDCFHELTRLKFLAIKSKAAPCNQFIDFLSLHVYLQIAAIDDLRRFDVGIFRFLTHRLRDCVGVDLANNVAACQLELLLRYFQTLFVVGVMEPFLARNLMWCLIITLFLELKVDNPLLSIGHKHINFWILEFLFLFFAGTSEDFPGQPSVFLIKFLFLSLLEKFAKIFKIGRFRVLKVFF